MSVAKIPAFDPSDAHAHGVPMSRGPLSRARAGCLRCRCRVDGGKASTNFDPSWMTGPETVRDALLIIAFIRRTGLSDGCPVLRPRPHFYIRALLGTNIQLAWPYQLGLGVSHHLDPVRNPPHRSRDCKDRREHRHRNADRAHDDA